MLHTTQKTQNASPAGTLHPDMGDFEKIAPGLPPEIRWAEALGHGRADKSGAGQIDCDDNRLAGE